MASAVKKLITIIKILFSLSNISLFALRFLSKTPSSLSCVKAKAGKISVTKFTQIICEASTGKGHLKIKDNVTAVISVKALDKRYKTVFLMLAKIIRP